MPNRKYGVFNIKMTITMKEGRMSRRTAVSAAAPDQRPERRSFEKAEPECETKTLRKAQGTLTVTWLKGAVLWSRRAHEMRRKGRLLSAIIVTVSVTSVALAQPEVIRCLPPEVPITDLPAAVLSEYRTEIAAEFEAYFTAVSTHIACLDTERSRTLSEARAATEAFTTFLNTPLTQKDLP
jgi:hypothetical protein